MCITNDVGKKSHCFSLDLIAAEFAEFAIDLEKRLLVMEKQARSKKKKKVPEA